MIEKDLVTTHNSNDLRLLRMPALEQQHLAIVGGGPGGLLAAQTLIREIEQEEPQFLTDRRAESRFADLSSVALLSGGDSLAFSPVSGEFATFLALYGSESISRDTILKDLRGFVKHKFAEHRFDFRTNSAARKIVVSTDGRFVIKADSVDKSSNISAKKLIVAIGHSLKERPLEMRNWLFRGTQDLCARLETLLPAASSREEALDKLFSTFAKTSEGVVRIGLVGLGATFLEALKIFHGLLSAPQHEHDVYRTKGSGIPVQFVVYDGRLNSEQCPTRKMRSLIEGLHARLNDSPEPDSLLTSDGVRRYKANEMHRVNEFSRTGQISIIPERFDWSSVKLAENRVISCGSNGRCEVLSFVVDCSPFSVGLSAEQRHVIEDIPGLVFNTASDGSFITELSADADQSSIALVGSAFTPKDEWGLSVVKQQAARAIEKLFPSHSGRIHDSLS